ncbi:MAG: zf-TFIIB domain-containing protein [Anaerolineae bacterium]|nr:zf-TFIIB domain-containing protein [Anaerolineae bacterium]
MDCPKCQSPMEAVVYESFEVNRCTKCKGLWFDLREQEHLKALEGSERIDVGTSGEGAAYNEIGGIECPICRTLMIRMVDAQQPHIWYESCPTCYGVFFDAGEFRDYRERTILDLFKDLTAKERK